MKGQVHWKTQQPAHKVAATDLKALVDLLEHSFANISIIANIPQVHVTSAVISFHLPNNLVTTFFLKMEEAEAQSRSS